MVYGESHGHLIDDATPILVREGTNPAIPLPQIVITTEALYHISTDVMSFECSTFQTCGPTTESFIAPYPNCTADQ